MRTTSLTSRQIVLNNYPHGTPTLNDVRDVEAKVQLSYDQPILLKLIFLSVDPYMRTRLNVDNPPYIERLEINRPIVSMAIAEVIESRDDEFQKGSYVMGMLPWQEYACCDKQTISKIPYHDIPLSYYLGIMGMPGLTAYVGINRIAKPKPGEAVFISSAAGAVGHVALQLAKQYDVKVIASTGCDLKAKFLVDELGCDSVVNYNNYPTWSDYASNIQELCPNGIDTSFENVGGNHLEEMLKLIKPNGRLVICGLISQYNQDNPRQGPANFGLIQKKSIRAQDFIVNDYISDFEQYQQMMHGLIKRKTVTTKETIYHGLENAWQAFIDLFNGKNVGKMVVKIS